MNKPLLALLLLALATSCGSSHSQGTVALLVTDAPVPYELVHTATVKIDQVTIDGGPSANDSARLLYSGDPLSVELCGLRNGAVLHLLSRTVPTHRYRRVRVHFSGAELVLASGRVFSSEDGSLEMPRPGSGWFDLALDTPVHVTEDHWSRLMLDIDVPRSFAPQGSDNLQLATSVKFDPLVHALRPGQTGEIRGLVTRLGESGPEPVADATVFFLPSGTEDLEMAAGSTGTDADGAFAKIGLRPGTYDVVALRGSAQITLDACLVTPGSYSIVELSLP
jgi:hypothetical protein